MHTVDSPVVCFHKQSAEMQKFAFATRETTWIVGFIPAVIDAASSTSPYILLVAVPIPRRDKT